MYIPFCFQSIEPWNTLIIGEWDTIRYNQWKFWML